MSEHWDHTNDEKCYDMWKTQESRAQRAEIELLHTKKDLATEKARVEKLKRELEHRSHPENIKNMHVYSGHDLPFNIYSARSGRMMANISKMHIEWIDMETETSE